MPEFGLFMLIFGMKRPVWKAMSACRHFFEHEERGGTETESGIFQRELPFDAIGIYHRSKGDFIAAITFQVQRYQSHWCFML